MEINIETRLTLKIDDRVISLTQEEALNLYLLLHQQFNGSVYQTPNTGTPLDKYKPYTTCQSI